jgi:hypothetical protein
MTDHAIGAYHLSRRGVQHYVITFVSNLWQVGGFLLAQKLKNSKYFFFYYFYIR